MSNIINRTSIGMTIAVSLVLVISACSLVDGNVYAAKPGVGSGQCVDNERDCQPSKGDAADPNAQGSAGGDSVSGGSVNNDAACNGLSQLGGTSCANNEGENAVKGVARRVVEIISYLAGIIAIIMIIISGVRYMTSGGDSSKVGAAKTALIYALIGIAVAALAQVLVNFVLKNARV